MKSWLLCRRTVTYLVLREEIEEELSLRLEHVWLADALNGISSGAR